MLWGMGNNELTWYCKKITVSDISRNTLLQFSLPTVYKQARLGPVCHCFMQLVNLADSG
jgi:hypothetical protein